MKIWTTLINPFYFAVAMDRMITELLCPVWWKCSLAQTQAAMVMPTQPCWKSKEVLQLHHFHQTSWNCLDCTHEDDTFGQQHSSPTDLLYILKLLWLNLNLFRKPLLAEKTLLHLKNSLIIFWGLNQLIHTFNIILCSLEVTNRSESKMLHFPTLVCSVAMPLHQQETFWKQRQ